MEKKLQYEIFKFLIISRSLFYAILEKQKDLNGENSKILNTSVQYNSQVEMKPMKKSKYE